MHFDENVVDYSKDMAPNTVLSGTVGNKVMLKNYDSVGAETIYYDGSKFAQILNSSEFNLSTSFTVSVWEFLVENVAASASFALSIPDGSSHCGLLFGYSDVTNRYMYCSSNGTAWDQIGGYSLGVPIFNEWVNWEIGYDQPTKKLYLFKNGVLVNTFTLTANPIYQTTRFTKIGTYSANVKSYINFSFIPGVCLHTTGFTPVPLESTKVTKFIHPMISDVQRKFGGASLYTNGANYLSFPNTTALSQTSEDFTVSVWEYMDGTAATNSASFVLNKADVANNGLVFGFCSAGNLYLYASSILYITNIFDIANAVLLESVANVVNKWVHWEVGYKSSSKMLYVFLNGELKYAVVCANPLYTPVISSSGYLGASPAHGIARKSYFDEFLILPGVCLHTDTFSPPTEPYSLPVEILTGMQITAISSANKQFVAPGKQLAMINGNKGATNSAGKTFGLLNKGQSPAQNYFGKSILPLTKSNLVTPGTIGVAIFGNIGSHDPVQYAGKCMDKLLHDSNAAYKFDLMVTPTHVFRTQLANVVSNYRPNLGLTGKYRLKVGEEEVIPYGSSLTDLGIVECDITQSMLDYGVNKCRLEYLYPEGSTEFLDFEVVREEPRRTLVERTFKRYDGGYDGSRLTSAPFGISKSPCFFVPEDSASTLIKTTDYTSISLTKNRGVLGVNVDASGAKILVSFDQGGTWKSHGVDGWYDAGSIENIATVGLSEDVINSITSAQWADVFTSTSLDFAVHLDNKLSAYVDISKDALVYSVGATYSTYTWENEDFLITKVYSTLGSSSDSIVAYYPNGTSEVVARGLYSNTHSSHTVTFDGVTNKHPNKITIRGGWWCEIYAAPKLAYLRSINVTLSDRFKTGYAFVI
jgi:hypothetical protein